jgi:dTDP-4-amino-4,6-dideoxygalactose transaminase
MTAFLSRALARFAKKAPWLFAWAKRHRFGINMVAHCILFALSYGLSFLMLGELFSPGEARSLFWRTLPVLVFIQFAVFWYHDLYEGLWVYVSFADVINIIRAAGISTLIFAFLGVFVTALRVPEKLIILDACFCIMAVYGARVAVRTVHEKFLIEVVGYTGQEILLAGPLKRVQTLASEMLSDPTAYYKPVAVVDISEGHNQPRQRISDIPVLSIKEAMSERVRFQKVRYIVVCWPNATQTEFDRLVKDLKPMGLRLTTLPYLDELLPPEPEISEKPSGADYDTRGSDRQLPEGQIRRRIFLSPPHMSGLEQEFVRRAFRSNFIAPLGPMVDAFEQEFTEITGIPHAVALSSGTVAIHLALQGMGVGPGDTVIASNLTFVGSVTPILFLGATPILVDSDPETWTMDINLLSAVLEGCADSGQLPKAVLPTDLYGQCSDYDSMSEICEKYGVPLIVDAAEAMGAKYKGRHAGNGVDASIFSFNGNKIITTSGGGMLASKDGALVDYARFLSQQARDPFPHYEHSQLGYNYRMSNIVAAIGQGQLRSLEDRVRRKRAIFSYYQEALKGNAGITFMSEAPYGVSNRWLTVILVEPEQFGADREAIRLALEEQNIESRPVWKPMHLQPVFDCIPISDDNFPIAKDGPRSAFHGPRRYKAYCIGGQVSETLFEKGLCLPSGTSMSDGDLERVVDVLIGCCGRCEQEKTGRAVAEARYGVQGIR